MQLWLVPGQAMAITQILCYPQHKVLMVVHMAGDGMEDWFAPLVGELEAFGRNMGCKYAEEYGRKGWVKPAGKLGWKPAFTVLRKDLNG